MGTLQKVGVKCLEPPRGRERHLGTIKNCAKKVKNLLNRPFLHVGNLILEMGSKHFAPSFLQLPPPAVFHDKYQWDIWKNTARKSASFSTQISFLQAKMLHYTPNKGRAACHIKLPYMWRVCNCTQFILLEVKELGQSCVDIKGGWKPDGRNNWLLFARSWQGSNVLELF